MTTEDAVRKAWDEATCRTGAFDARIFIRELDRQGYKVVQQ